MIFPILIFELYISDLLIQPEGHMSQHVFFDDMFCQVGAGMAIEFICTSVFYVYTFTAIFQLLFFAIAGIIVSTPWTFDQRTENLGIVIPRADFVNADLSKLFKLL